MCMMAVGMLGAGIGALGALQQGSAKAAADRRQAQEYQTNSQLEQRQSTAEEITGQYQQRRMREKGDQMAATQIANYAGGGLALSGSPTDVIMDSRRESALDIAAIKYNTDLKSDNLIYKSRVDSYNADSAYKAADADQQAGMLGAFGKLIGGVTSLGGGF